MGGWASTPVPSLLSHNGNLYALAYNLKKQKKKKEEVEEGKVQIEMPGDDANAVT